MAEIIRELATGTISNAFSGAVGQRDSGGHTVGSDVRDYLTVLLNIQDKLLAGFNQRYLNVVDFTEEKLGVKNLFQSLGADADLAEKVLNNDPAGKTVLEKLSDKNDNEAFLKKLGKLFYEESFTHPADFVIAKMEIYDKVKLNDDIEPDLKRKLLSKLEPTNYENNFFQFFVENKKNIELAITAHSKFNEIEALSYFLNVAYDLRGETDLVESMFKELKSWHVVKSGNKTAFLTYIDPEDNSKEFKIDLELIRNTTSELKEYYEGINGKTLDDLAEIAKRPDTATKLAISQKNEAVVALAQVFSFYPGGVGTSAIEGSPADVQINSLFEKVMNILEEEQARVINGYNNNEKSTIPKKVTQKQVTKDGVIPGGVSEWFTFREAIESPVRNKKMKDRVKEFHDSYKGNPKNNGVQQDLTKRDVLQYILYQEMFEHANRLAPGRDHDGTFTAIMDLAEATYASNAQMIESFQELPDGGMRGLGCQNGKGANRIDVRNSTRAEYIMAMIAKHMGTLKDNVADGSRNIFHFKGKGAEYDLPDAYGEPIDRVPPKPDPEDTAKADRHDTLRYLYAKANLAAEPKDAFSRGIDATTKITEETTKKGFGTAASKVGSGSQEKVQGWARKASAAGFTKIGWVLNGLSSVVKAGGWLPVAAGAVGFFIGGPIGAAVGAGLTWGGQKVVGALINNPKVRNTTLAILGFAGVGIGGYKAVDGLFVNEHELLEGVKAQQKLSEYAKGYEAFKYDSRPLTEDKTFQVPPGDTLMLNGNVVVTTDSVNVTVPEGSQKFFKNVTIDKGFGRKETKEVFEGAVTADPYKTITLQGIKWLDKKAQFNYENGVSANSEEINFGR